MNGNIFSHFALNLQLIPFFQISFKMGNRISEPEEGEKLRATDNMGQCNVFRLRFAHFSKFSMYAWGKKRKLLVFTAVYVCVKAKLTLVRFFFNFFFAPFPYALPNIIIACITTFLMRSSLPWLSFSSPSFPSSLPPTPSPLTQERGCSTVAGDQMMPGYW